MTQDEFLAEAKKRFGESTRCWKFVCPMCGTVQSVQQLLDAVHGYIGYSCIGRFTGMGDEGIAAHNRGEPWDGGCNWTLGGFLRCHTLEVTLSDKAVWRDPQSICVTNFPPIWGQQIQIYTNAATPL